MYITKGSWASREFPSLTDITDFICHAETWKTTTWARFGVCLNRGKGEGSFVTVSQQPIEPFSKLVHVNQSPLVFSKLIDLIFLLDLLFPWLMSHSGENTCFSQYIILLLQYNEGWTFGSLVRFGSILSIIGSFSSWNLVIIKKSWKFRIKLDRSFRFSILSVTEVW